MTILVSDGTPFDTEMFSEVDSNSRDDMQVAMHTTIGSLTVLDRMTGFGFRDIESGYRDICGTLWLASGGCDVRRSGAKTIGEAIQWVKDRANTSVAVETRN